MQLVLHYLYDHIELSANIDIVQTLDSTMWMFSIRESSLFVIIVWPI